MFLVGLVERVGAPQMENHRENHTVIGNTRRLSYVQAARDFNILGRLKS